VAAAVDYSEIYRARTNLQNALDASALAAAKQMAVTNDEGLLKAYARDFFDLIIIDEIEQFHQHLGGDTMRGSEPERAYRVLRQLVKETPHFLGMDAHATNVSRDWLSGVLGGDQHVTCIYNQYRGSRGQLTLHDNKETAINTALRLAEENQGVVVIPTNTRGMAKQLHHIFSEALGEAHVCVIHGGNSNDQEIQDFIRTINSAINTYKILIYPEVSNFHSY
ncbi:MAG: DEAD/DEAH box helicase, partial [Coleofasciculaceae cyanobacterium SM2_1_6]|nr:DEAD/DEAH box helicase [Coleofasciculaceae cyanobacterium SM2_1_6]